MECVGALALLRHVCGRSRLADVLQRLRSETRLLSLEDVVFPRCVRSLYRSCSLAQLRVAVLTQLVREVRLPAVRRPLAAVVVTGQQTFRKDFQVDAFSRVGTCSRLWR